MASPKVGQIIVIVSGANNLLTEDEIEAVREEITNSSYLLFQLEIDLNLTMKALCLAREVGTKTILNLAPAVNSLPEEIYELTDIFCPNETDAQILTGIKIDTVESAKLAAQVLLNYGIKTVVITLGRNCCLIVDSQRAIHIPADKIKVVDKPGAGDCFIGALAHLLALGLNLEQSATRAVRVSSMSVQGKGTQASFPDRNDIPVEILN